VYELLWEYGSLPLRRPVEPTFPTFTIQATRNNPFHAEISVKIILIGTSVYFSISLWCLLVEWM